MYQNSGCFERSLQRSSGQARIAFSSMSIAAPNCGQMIVFQKASTSRRVYTGTGSAAVSTPTTVASAPSCRWLITESILPKNSLILKGLET